MIQDTAWTLSLVFMGLVAAVFAVVCFGASRSGNAAQPYRGRSWLFIGLLVAGVAITFATLMPWPQVAYAGKSAVKPALTVKAVAYQWRWDLSTSEVPVGQPVEFLVSAADVNHGFAIYKGGQQILGQVQAMPGFTNRLVVTFPEAGEYELLCLEYCGVAHHNMKSVITAR